MVDGFDEKLMHNKERKLRKDGLNMTAFNSERLLVLTCTRSQL